MRRLFDAIRSGWVAAPNRQLIELDLHINDPEFAAALVRQFRKSMRKDICMIHSPIRNPRGLSQKNRGRAPIIGGGAGTGLSAKCEEAGGIDLIVIYNSGRYRMAGRGSLAGLLAYGNANDIVVEMAREVLPVVKHTPVLAGVNGTDPFMIPDQFLDQLKTLGFAGVQNFPTVGLIDGVFRANLEETGMGYALEVEMIERAAKKDMLTTPYVFSADDAVAMTRPVPILSFAIWASPPAAPSERKRR